MSSWIRVLVVLLVLLASPLARAAGPSKQECVDANDSAQDLRRADKLLQAREKLSVCVAATCPGVVREDCAQRLSELDAVTPSLVFEVKDGSGGDRSAVHVTMDGRVVTDRLDGSAWPVDPGEHQVVFDDGSARVERAIFVRDGDKDRHVLVTLGPGAVQGPLSAETRPTDGSRVPALAGFGIGGVGLVIGTIFTIEGVNAQSSATSACGPAGNQCPGDASSRNGAIRTDTAVAVTGFGIAAAGAVVGALLLPHAQPSLSQGRRVVPILGIGYAGVGGSF